MLILGLALFDIFVAAVVGIVLLLLLAGDRKLWAWGIVGAIAAYFLYNGWSGAVEWATTPGALLSASIWLGGFLGIGFGFSFVKWYFFNRKVARRFAAHLKTCKVTDRHEQSEMLSRFNGYAGYKGLLKVIAKSDGGYDTDYDTWSLSSYVASWTVFWPLYALLILVEDFLKELFDALTRMFGQVYRRISSAAFNDIRGDVLPNAPAERDIAR